WGYQLFGQAGPAQIRPGCLGARRPRCQCHLHPPTTWPMRHAGKRWSRRPGRLHVAERAAGLIAVDGEDQATVGALALADRAADRGRSTLGVHHGLDLDADAEGLLE